MIGELKKSNCGQRYANFACPFLDTYHKFSIHVIDDELDTFFGLSTALSLDALDVDADAAADVRLKSFFVKFSNFDVVPFFVEFCDVCSDSAICASFMSGSDCVRRTILLRYLRNGYLSAGKIDRKTKLD